MRWSLACSVVKSLMVVVIRETLLGKTTIVAITAARNTHPIIVPNFFFFMMKVSQIHCRMKSKTMQSKPALDRIRMTKMTRVI